ncbi:hypothetical protein [Mycobacterium sp. E2497]|uniref:hypothetical protein n=1 Tax=Mycobacterium sp. E2497 TaxID=1834135 RepID=UPI0007FE9202|nr:hypothetical protein [Mycobacterium sp. E2497]OBI10465.1 hypothetical protein A5713_07685 [Mycobacterium sp. E2497]
MTTSRTATAGVAAAAALAVAIAGCGKHSTTSTPSKSGSSSSATSAPSSTPTSSASAQANQYVGLLIQASDINAPIPFTATPPTSNPNGQPGVATTFKDEDGSHVIKDTIQVLADPDAATNALNTAKGAQGDVIKNPTTQAANVGTGGTTLMGNSPDKSKGVTILLFTEGKAFVTLEFDGPPDTLAPADFVNDVGQKQDAAIKKGLGG